MVLTRRFQSPRRIIFGILLICTSGIFVYYQFKSQLADQKVIIPESYTIHNQENRVHHIRETFVQETSKLGSEAFVQETSKHGSEAFVQETSKHGSNIEAHQNIELSLGKGSRKETDANPDIQKITLKQKESESQRVTSTIAPKIDNPSTSAGLNSNIEPKSTNYPGNNLTSSNGSSEVEYTTKPGRNLTTTVKKSQSVNTTYSNCPDVASGIMKGKWRTRPLLTEESAEIETLLSSVRKGFKIPESLQREDGKCGNLTYNGLDWFRALCNPKGETPCCYDNQCVSRPSDQCQCATCFDLRTQVHAEYSQWVPEDWRCKVENYTQQTACDLLQGSEMVFVGDSLVRHVYTAFLLLLSGNGYDGALQDNVPKEIYDACTGMYIFTEKVCRKNIPFSRSFCNGQTKASFHDIALMSLKQSFFNLVKKLLGKPKSYIFVGIGPHDVYKKTVYSDFMFPALQIVQNANQSWPKFVWATTHKFGPLKTPLRPEQEWQSVKVFNEFMMDKLRPHNVTIFDTFDVTSGLSSPDGAHFGFGMNVLKAQMYLTLLGNMKTSKHA